MLEKELNFVWGAPLCGQRRWMLRSAELTPLGKKLALCFSDSEQSFESLLKQVESVMKIQENGIIYVEWPSSLLYYDIELEAWLAKHGDWRPSFTSVLLEDCAHLNGHYREFYEEFARATLSTVIVARSELKKNENLKWIGVGGIEFGKRIQVFQEDLWPQPRFERTGQELKVLHDYEEEYEEVSFPVVTEISDYLLEKVFEELSSGDFGSIWGMEFLKRDLSVKDDSSGSATGATKEATALDLYSLTPGQYFQCKSELNKDIAVYGISEQVGILRIAGVGIPTASIREYLTANELLQAS